MIPEPIKRDYTTSDAFMLQHASTLRTMFLVDQAQFVSRDPDFDSPFDTDWQTAITQAETDHYTDEAVDAELVQLTNAVEAQMVVCRNMFQDMKPFIKKAFPNDEAAWAEFGFNSYQKVDKSQLLMIQFMTDLHGKAIKFAPALAAANFTAAMTGAINMAKNALAAANNAQEAFKLSMPGITRARIVAHNAVWNTYVRPVAETGKLIFRNDHSKYQIYLLPASDETDENINFDGEVRSAAGVPLDAVAVYIPALGVTVLTDSNGRFAMAVLPVGNYVVRFTKAGYVAQDHPAEITEEGTVTINVTMVPLP